MTATHPTKPRLGVSACLLGQPVRYDGADKRESLVVEQLSQVCDLVPFCPEVAIGLGVPRETITLVGDPANPRAIGTQTPGHDVTDALKKYARSLQSDIATLAGYIVKTRSPSCGWQSTNVYENLADAPIGRVNGIFIGEVLRLFPELPIIDEEQLRDPTLRQRFLDAVRWRHCQRL